MGAFKAYLLGLIAAFLWGTHSVIVRFLSSSQISLVSVAIVRLYVGAITIFFLLKITNRKVNMRKCTPGFWLVLLSWTANMVFFHLGLGFTTATATMLLESTSAIFVLLFVLMIGRKLKKREILAIPLGFCGASLVIMGGSIDLLGSSTPLGYLLELLAAISFAFFIFFSKKYLTSSKKTWDRMESLLKLFFFSALLMTPALFLSPISLTFVDIVLLLTLGIFPTAVLYLCYYEAMNKLSAISAALIFNLSVVFTMINSSLFLSERIQPTLIGGAMLIVFGLILAKR
ncbi:MAG: DMT family transporter [Candidatus Diapherotrites archaeon]|nr:DMT family transporter [Candidatus Diapherotrites archaeon]